MSKLGSKVGVLLGAALFALLATSASAQTVEDIIEKSLKAQGGREALTTLKCVERKGEVDVDGAFGQMEGTVEECVVPGKKALRALDLAVFVQKDGFNGEVAWREGMNGLQDLEGDEALQIKQSVILNPLLMIGVDGVKAEKLDDEKIDDKDYYVLELKAEDRPAIKLFIDKESDLFRRMTLVQNNPQFGEVEIVTESSDYEDFGPVKLPTKQKIALGEILNIDTTYTETKVNGDIDETIFDKPKEEAPAEEKKDDAKDSDKDSDKGDDKDDDKDGDK